GLNSPFGRSHTISHLVRTRNLSRGGMSFLLGGFVHNNTRCTVLLATPHRALDDMCGTVVRCRYIEGNLHEVGVRFDQNIDPAAYCRAAVHARVLLAEDDPAVARLVVFHLEKLNARVDHAENGREAIDKAMQNAYDVILMDMDMPVIDGFGALRELRGGGYTGMIVAATGMTQPGDRERCLSAGCDGYIAKPYQRRELCDLLESLRDEPLFSRFRNDPSMIGIIDAFVVELPAKIRALQEAVVQRDVNRLQHLTRALKGEGSSYGFDVITEAAARIEKALIEGFSLEDVSKDTAELVKLCRQARSSAGITESRPTSTSKKEEDEFA
ncbi:unnamed protein product, partial [marine sediment metagenome]